MHTGQTVPDLDLTEFIRLYVNHRPSIPLSNVDIVAAFDTLQKKYQIVLSLLTLLINVQVS